MIKRYLLITAIILMAFTANAQNSNFADLIKSSPADATKLIQNYADPLFKGFGIGLNEWLEQYRKNKEIFTFRLISANVTQIPVSG